MKTRTITFISITILAALMIGAFAFNAMSAPKEAKLKVKWRPNTITLDGYVADPWIAQVFFAPARPLTDIDPSTVRLEGIYTLESTPYTLGGTPPRLALPFHGYDVLTAITTKMPHMTSGIYYVGLTITGHLYDGTPFSGTGYITVTVPELPSP